jgi:hypothetical protein
LLSELYVYLTQEVHRTLATVRQSADEKVMAHALASAPSDEKLVLIEDDAQRAQAAAASAKIQQRVLQEKLANAKRQADEAERGGDLRAAASRYQDRLVWASKDAQCWYEYALFCLRAGDTTKAAECLKEGLVHSPNHIARY